MIAYSIQQLGYMLDDVGVQLQAGARYISLLQNVYTSSKTHPAFCSVGARVPPQR